MGGFRRAARRDTVHAEIERVARRMGASWLNLPGLVGEGTPDALVGFCGSDALWEIKSGKLSPSRRKLRPGQVLFALTWKGRTPVVIKSVDEAIDALLAMRA